MMKIQFILFSIFISIAHLAQGQTQKGDLTLGGQGTFTIIRDNGLKMITQISANSGHFVNDNLMVQGQLVMVLNTVLSDGSWGFGAGTGVRQYFGRGKTQPFLGGYIYYAINRNILGADSYFNHLDLTADFGVSHFIKENIALEFSIPVKYIRFYQNSAFFSTINYDQLEVMTNIGFRFFINRKQETE